MAALRVLDQYDDNAEPNFAALKHSGVTGYIHKISEGANSRFTREIGAAKAKRRIAAARKAGLRVGGYHFARPDLHPTLTGAFLEAQNYVWALKAIGHKPGDFKPLLDYEAASNLSAKQQVDWIRTFNRTVEQHLGSYPIFYTYPSRITELHPAKPLGSGLWLAGGLNLPRRPWKRAYMVQTISHVNGEAGKADLSFYGTKFGALPLIHKPIRSALKTVRESLPFHTTITDMGG